MMRPLAILLLINLIISSTADKPCRARDYGKGSIVCVCNESYCDTVSPLPANLSVGNVVVYESTKTGDRLKQSIVNVTGTGLQRSREKTVVITIDKSTRYQKIDGFGGAFTDAAGFNIIKLSNDLSSQIISDYFSENGLGYSLCRAPIGGTDFSMRGYTYDESPDDFELTNFTLAMEDHTYKIPLMKKALNLRPNLKFFASAWTAPTWMKTNNQFIGGSLIGKPGGKYYKTWAKYYVKFLQAYAKEGINFSAITSGNEPANGKYIPTPINSMGFSPSDQRDFIAKDLGPTLAEAGYGKDKLQLWIMDDQTISMPLWSYIVLSNKDAAQYISGIAYHWYVNTVVPRFFWSLTHKMFPDMKLHATEACEGFNPVTDREKVMLGSWERGEHYGRDIILDLNYQTSSWIDWNIALDLDGGPNWNNNPVDSPIIVNATANEYYKNPMFYFLGHFSKFLPPGSIRVHSSANVDQQRAKVYFTVFFDIENRLVLITQNQNDHSVNIVVNGGFSESRPFKFNLKPRSISSFIGATDA